MADTPDARYLRLLLAGAIHAGLREATEPVYDTFGISPDWYKAAPPTPPADDGGDDGD